MDKVLLGGWGHSRLDPGIYLYDFWWETGLRAGVLHWRPRNHVERIYMQGQAFGRTPYPGNRFGELRVSIPPLSRMSEGGFDYYPFLLYHQVVMDAASYSYILDTTNSLSTLPRWSSIRAARILEDLRQNGVLVIEDYAAALSDTSASREISQALQDDIADSRVLDSCLSSMRLWASYLAEVAQFDSDRAPRIFENVLPRLRNAQEAIQAGRAHTVPDIGAYLYECLGDINSTMFLARAYDLPIYDWESYLPFYEHKMTRLGELGRSTHIDKESGVLKRLLEIFVPSFTIRSVDDIMTIRADSKFAATRAAIAASDLGEDADELIREAADGILRMKEAQERFGKVVKWTTLPLDFLPVPAVGTALEEAAERTNNARLEKKYAWQMFFLDARKRYGRDSVKRIFSRRGGESS